MSWGDRLRRCRDAAREYFRAQALEDGSGILWRHSPVHDVQGQTGHLLYGSWAGILGSALLGALPADDSPLRDAMASGLNRFQGPDGLFRMPSVSPEALDGHDDEYFSFHCTNYALGALDALGRAPAVRPAFLDRFRDPQLLTRWLDGRGWKRPWTEGNTVVNLASFFEIEARRGDGDAGARLTQIADWLEAHQRPETGFWHDDGVPYLQSMAGAAHVLHVFHALGRPVPRFERIVDSCLENGYPGIRAACPDLDLVDILGHLRPYGHRIAAIDQILRRYLAELLQIQNRDGGFCDSYVAPQVTYGLKTPRDVSVTWTTWFRLATIGMISATLVPGEAASWHFRRTLGSGYFHPSPRIVSAGDHAKDGPAVSRLEERLLATVRGARFLRQSLTLQARRWVGPGPR